MITLGLLSHSPHCTGAERCLFNLALLLRDVPNIRPVLFIPGPGGPLPDMAAAHGLVFECLPPAAWYPFSAPSTLSYWESLARSAPAVKQALTNHACDALLINTLTNVSGALAAVELDLPAVLWAHGIIDSGLSASRAGAWATLNDHLLLQTATRIVVNSDWTGRFFSQMLGYGSKVERIYNWTPVRDDVRAPADKYRRPRCVCLSTFDRHKGYDVLLQAAAILRDRQVPLELELYGMGSTRAEMQALSQRLSLDDVVKFNDRTGDVDSVMDRSFCHVSPSYIEPFGMTIIEAMARKTPVIATASGGPQEIIRDGVSGLLVPPGDAVALADKMEYLLQRPDAAEQMGEQGYIRVRDCFSEEVARDSFGALIRGAVEAFRGYPSEIGTSWDMYRIMLENATDHHHLIAFLSGAVTALSQSELGSQALRDLPRMVQNSVAEAGGVSTKAAGASLALPRPFPGRSVRLKKRLAYRVSAAQAGWHGLDVLVGTHQRPATGGLILRVLTPAGSVLREAAVDLELAVDNSWLSFDFSPIANSAGQRFVAEFSLSARGPDTRISLYETGEPIGRLGLAWFYLVSLSGLQPLRDSLWYHMRCS
jgi:glycosyltransferase involved in cell wall biosynthesis